MWRPRAPRAAQRKFLRVRLDPLWFLVSVCGEQSESAIRRVPERKRGGMRENDKTALRRELSCVSERISTCSAARRCECMSRARDLSAPPRDADVVCERLHFSRSPCRSSMRDGSVGSTPPRPPALRHHGGAARVMWARLRKEEVDRWLRTFYSPPSQEENRWCAGFTRRPARPSQPHSTARASSAPRARDPPLSERRGRRQARAPARRGRTAAAAAAASGGRVRRRRPRPRPRPQPQVAEQASSWEARAHCEQRQ